MIRIVKGMMCRHNAVPALLSLLKAYVDGAVQRFEQQIEQDAAAAERMETQDAMAAAATATATATATASDSSKQAADGSNNKSKVPPPRSGAADAAARAKAKAAEAAARLNPRAEGVRLLDDKMADSFASTLLNLASEQGNTCSALGSVVVCAAQLLRANTM